MGHLPLDPTLLDEATTKIVELVTSDAFLGGTARSIGNVTELVTGSILALITLFFFLKERPYPRRGSVRPQKPSIGKGLTGPAEEGRARPSTPNLIVELPSEKHFPPAHGFQRFGSCESPDVQLIVLQSLVVRRDITKLNFRY